jgi:hypothetical protein
METELAFPTWLGSDQSGRSFALSKENAMDRTADGRNRPVSKHLHPLVYEAIIGLALWYVLSVWLGFAGGGYTDYLLTVATFFVFGALALPLISWRVWHQSRRPGGVRDNTEPFNDWALSEVEIGNGRIRGTTALVEILLPIAAVAFGMTAFAILARLAG